ncbi:MAG: K+-dependent Na+/Ca+ exchanger [Leptospiraceae bacterium]|nr:MAG: K+-dependent Na+/Ca+ exchanger [Leptospiraceae bacterium]
MDITTIIDYLLFLPGFYLLIKGADILVEGATSLARRLNVSDLVIGLTIVSIGTSAPELAVNINSSIKGQSDLAISNILGSNIANILLILGICAIIKNIFVKENTIWKEIPFSLLGSIVILIQANDVFFGANNSNYLSRNDGLVILAFFIIFIYYVFSIAKKDNIFEDEIPKKQLSLFMSFLYLILGLILLPLGSEWVVNGAVQIAKLFHLSEAFIGLTIVAVGTSLPELAASSVATYKGNTQIAIGNVVGSNIFNIFFILGISSCIKPLHFTMENNIDALITVIVSFILFSFLFIGKRHELERNQGIMFVVLYIIYIIFRAYIGLQNNSI